MLQNALSDVLLKTSEVNHHTLARVSDVLSMGMVQHSNSAHSGSCFSLMDEG